MNGPAPSDAEALLRKALQPFADFIAGTDPTWDDRRRIATLNYDFDKLTVGVFRAAAAALALPPPAEPAGWQDIASAPCWHEGLKVWVYGGRHHKPTLVSAEGQLWRSEKLSGFSWVPTHWHPHFVPTPPADGVPE